jgi:hypothetical protein
MMKEFKESVDLRFKNTAQGPEIKETIFLRMNNFKPKLTISVIR